MLGPMITQESIDKSPWWFKMLFYGMGYTYLAVGAVLYVASYPVGLIKHMWSKIAHN